MPQKRPIIGQFIELRQGGARSGQMAAFLTEHSRKYVNKIANIMNVVSFKEQSADKIKESL